MLQSLEIFSMKRSVWKENLLAHAGMATGRLADPANGPKWSLMGPFRPACTKMDHSGRGFKSSSQISGTFLADHGEISPPPPTWVIHMATRRSAHNTPISFVIIREMFVCQLVDLDLFRLESLLVGPKPGQCRHGGPI